METKGNLVNALIINQLSDCARVYISRNLNFYSQSGIIQSLFEDHVHLNAKEGSGMLAKNIRQAIRQCVGLSADIPVKNRPRRRQQSTSSSNGYENYQNDTSYKYS